MTPPLAEWLRWIAEMPPVFSATPEGFPEGRVRVGAVISDLFETLFDTPVPEALLKACQPAALTPGERNRLGWYLAASHALMHPALRNRLASPADVERLLVQELPALASVVDVQTLKIDELRREELVRRILRTAGLLLPGEDAKGAEDQFRQVDSIERQRILADAADRERRARQVREEMARASREAAAAKTSRE